jgi:hypothetical protein
MPETAPKKIIHNKKQSESTVIFVDWDDTLLCSSYLSHHGLRLDSEIDHCEDILRELKELEASVASLLRLATTFGEVHVITNAETGWVQLSAKKFLPGVLPLLDNIHICSARSSFESMYPESPLKWKFCAFQERLQLIFHEKLHEHKNIISFGDSHVEREAVRAVTRGLSNTKTKSVKFAEKPSMEQLRRQLELVTNCFQYIHSHEGDLDLQLTVTKAAPSNNGFSPPPSPQKQPSCQKEQDRDSEMTIPESTQSPSSSSSSSSSSSLNVPKSPVKPRSPKMHPPKSPFVNEVAS